MIDKNAGERAHNNLLMPYAEKLSTDSTTQAIRERDNEIWKLKASNKDLLEALEYMLSCQYDYDPRRQADCDMCAQARAAIARARGES